MTIYNNMQEASAPFSGILLDAYGVFWGGNAFGPLPGAKKAMEDLVSSGKIVGILSNTTALAEKEITKLAKHGIIQGKHFHFFMSSGEITRELFLHQTLPFKTPRNTFCFLGETHPVFSPEKSLFENTPYTEVLEIGAADFLYVRTPHIRGEDQTDPTLFKHVVESLEIKPPMICANPDLFAHEGIPPRAVVRQGSIAAMYKELGGQVYYTGKPDPLAYFQAMEQFKKFGITEKRDVVMVGDNPPTDILGAKNFGMASAAVLTTGLMGDRVHMYGEKTAIDSLAEDETPSFCIKKL